jgi:hypothetical protein
LPLPLLLLLLVLNGLQVWAEFQQLHGEQLSSQTKVTEKALISKAKAGIRKSLIQSFSPYLRSDTATLLLTKGYVTPAAARQGRVTLAGGGSAAAAAAVDGDGAAAAAGEGEEEQSEDAAAAAAAAAGGGGGKKAKGRGSVGFLRRSHNARHAAASVAVVSVPDSMEDVGPYNLLDRDDAAAEE